MDIQEIISKTQNLTIDWLTPNSADYEDSRQISNARFSYRPAAIAYCGDEEAVAGLFRVFGDDPPEFRIRSGGHQHEGMCTADDVLLIDLSKMNKIDIQYNYTQRPSASIGPGCSLSDLYNTLGQRGLFFPGGGCGTVRPGGLIQGGGWGPYVRKHGMSCDSLLKAKVVLANGKVVIASETENEDLFWAIRGGGGGNFGVVTEYSVRLYQLPESKVSFRLHWTAAHRLDVAKAWLHLQASLRRELMSFCRITVVPDAEKGSDEAILVGGVYLGSKPEFFEAIEPLVSQMPAPAKERYDVAHTRAWTREAESGTAHGGGMSDFLAEIVNTIQFVDPSSLGSMASSETFGGAGSAEVTTGRSAKAPNATCDQPHPHKVSSTFPKKGCDYNQLAEELVGYIECSEFDEEVNRYVSLHCMGGAVSDKAPEATAFPHRTQDVLLQFQAWWAGQAGGKLDSEYKTRVEGYIQWVKDFRESLSHTEGAFINFIDHDVPLEEYYGGNFDRLREVKKTYDPNNLFSFEMSIPSGD